MLKYYILNLILTNTFSQAILEMRYQSCVMTYQPQVLKYIMQLRESGEDFLKMVLSVLYLIPPRFRKLLL